MWSSEIAKEYGIDVRAAHMSLRRSHDNGWLERHRPKGSKELFYCAGPLLVARMEKR